MRGRERLTGRELLALHRRLERRCRRSRSSGPPRTGSTAAPRRREPRRTRRATTPTRARRRALARATGSSTRGSGRRCARRDRRCRPRRRSRSRPSRRSRSGRDDRLGGLARRDRRSRVAALGAGRDAAGAVRAVDRVAQHRAPRVASSASASRQHLRRGRAALVAPHRVEQRVLVVLGAALGPLEQRPRAADRATLAARDVRHSAAADRGLRRRRLGGVVGAGVAGSARLGDRPSLGRASRRRPSARRGRRGGGRTASRRRRARRDVGRRSSASSAPASTATTSTTRGRRRRSPASSMRRSPRSPSSCFDLGRDLGRDVERLARRSPSVRPRRAPRPARALRSLRGTCASPCGTRRADGRARRAARRSARCSSARRRTRSASTRSRAAFASSSISRPCCARVLEDRLGLGVAPRRASPSARASASATQLGRLAPRPPRCAPRAARRPRRACARRRPRPRRRARAARSSAFLRMSSLASRAERSSRAVSSPSASSSSCSVSGRGVRSCSSSASIARLELLLAVARRRRAPRRRASGTRGPRSRRSRGRRSRTTGSRSRRARGAECSRSLAAAGRTRSSGPPYPRTRGMPCRPPARHDNRAARRIAARSRIRQVRLRRRRGASVVDTGAPPASRSTCERLRERRHRHDLDACCPRASSRARGRPCTTARYGGGSLGRALRDDEQLRARGARRDRLLLDAADLADVARRRRSCR